MTFLNGLRRTWVTIEVPGIAPPLPGFHTYVEYPHTPAVPDGIGDWAWLRAKPIPPPDPDSETAPVTDLTTDAVRAFVGPEIALPPDFAAFVADAELRRRVRSATWCYFDLAQHVVPVDGGMLLHFLSDSQSVMHWLLYLGTEGSAVVATAGEDAYDFLPGTYDEAAEPTSYVRCADTFAEFIWRWWMDNEIFYRDLEGEALTAEQAAYVIASGGPTPLRD